MNKLDKLTKSIIIRKKQDFNAIKKAKINYKNDIKMEKLILRIYNTNKMMFPVIGSNLLINAIIIYGKDEDSDDYVHHKKTHIFLAKNGIKNKIWAVEGKYHALCNYDLNNRLGMEIQYPLMKYYQEHVLKAMYTHYHRLMPYTFLINSHFGLALGTVERAINNKYAIQLYNKHYEENRTIK